MNNITQKNIKKNIMRRVYGIYIFRKVIIPLMAELAFIVILIAVSSSFISLRHVFQNMSALHSLSSLGSFFVGAFQNTQNVVKFLAIIVALVAIGFLYDSIRRIKRVTSTSIIGL